MGVLDGAPFLRPSQEYTDTLTKIRDSVKDNFPLDGDTHPLVLVDTSIFLVPLLFRKETLTQFFMLPPPVPVTSVAEGIQKTLALLTKHSERFLKSSKCSPFQLI